MYEAKKNMLICITKWKSKPTSDVEEKVKQQAQSMRGKGFLRVTMKEVKKSMDKAVA